MQPPSSRTGAWRTHHHRVATTPEGTACCETNGLSGLDISRHLQYCYVSYVRVQIASSVLVSEIEIPRNGKRSRAGGRNSWGALKESPSSSPARAAALAAPRRCCSPKKAPG